MGLARIVEIPNKETECFENSWHRMTANLPKEHAEANLSP